MIEFIERRKENMDDKGIRSLSLNLWRKTHKQTEQATTKEREMEGIGMQVVVPVIGIVAAAAVTFYVVSFSEIREVSFLFKSC